MNKYHTIFIIAILLIGLFPGCGDDSNEEPDGISMVTPDGGKLKSALEGPIRSALGEPAISLETFRLKVDGLVDASFSLSFGEIQELPATSTDTMIMYCVEGWEVWGIWKGVLIKDLFDKAGVQNGGEFVLFASPDGYQTAMPISYLVKYNAMLAYQVNNSPLQKHDGFPLRLIAFGKFGYKWAKWINKLTVIEKSQLGYWERYGYSDQGDVPVKRRRFYEGDGIEPLDY